MLDLKVTTEFNSRPLEQAVDRAAYKSFQHAAASIRKDAIESIEEAPRGEASAPGQPPHTRSGTFQVSKKTGKSYARKGTLPSAIRFAADKEGAIIGPVFSQAGTSGEAHEFGGEYKGDEFDERSFMGPALERNVDRFANDWAGGI